MLYSMGGRNARSPVKGLFSPLFTASCCFLLGLDALLDLPHSVKGTKTGRFQRVGGENTGLQVTGEQCALCDITEGGM